MYEDVTLGAGHRLNNQDVYSKSIRCATHFISLKWSSSRWFMVNLINYKLSCQNSAPNIFWGICVLLTLLTHFLFTFKSCKTPCTYFFKVDVP